ncbi:hypothetical protein CKK33_06955 [Mucilaginibacter sp. MD40]|uniref:hypothetical protein n=1 Tax=Mucilaginibacter sp. MD40 TaxID=2029590 RepID=UPI000BAC5650|nr:hypothetical protein [Mucilaginibacter sp. MD40]PAW93251.1 hypothetical protein CKK33_06955 [Mucilaginibacter sp. MD40]
MKEEKEDSIDKLFSRGLSDPGDNAQYREDDWDQMEAMLDGKKPRRKIGRGVIYIISAIAAMLLLVIGWLLYNNTPETQTNNTTTQVAATKEHPKDNSGNYGAPARQRKDPKSSTLSAGNSARGAAEMGRKSNSFFTLSAGKGGRTTTGAPGIVIPHYIAPVNDGATASQAGDTLVYKAQGQNMAVNTPIDTVVNAHIIQMAAVKNADSIIYKDKNGRELVSVMGDNVKPRKTVGTAVSYAPTFAVSVLASPDVNGVGGFNNTRVGTNAGLLFTLNMAKWSISTGAIYADKPYTSSFSQYTSSYQFSSNPTQVTASCTVLDIPLNVGYLVYHKNRDKFSIGTGLSSYFMLRENYTFTYAPNSVQGPASYSISNQNRHLFGVLNLNATYQRALSPRFGIGVQPYLKLPLTGIGYGQVNLRSAGVAVGVTWNILSGKTP